MINKSRIFSLKRLFLLFIIFFTNLCFAQEEKLHAEYNLLDTSEVRSDSKLSILEANGYEFITDKINYIHFEQSTIARSYLNENQKSIFQSKFSEIFSGNSKLSDFEELDSNRFDFLVLGLLRSRSLLIEKDGRAIDKVQLYKCETFHSHFWLIKDKDEIVMKIVTLVF